MTKLFAFLLMVLAAAMSPVLGHSHKKRGMEVVHPWTWATPSKEAEAVPVYMKIKNLTGNADRLISASTPIAAKTELREKAAKPGGPEQAGPLAIPGGSSLELKQDGPHLALSGVTKRLDAYENFKLTLVFEKAGRMVIDVMVEETEAPGAAHNH